MVAMQTVSDLTVGQRVKLIAPVAYRDGGAGGTIDIAVPAGQIGTVVDAGDALNPWIIVKMDAPFTCLADFDNTITFDRDDSGDQGVGPASDFLQAVSAQ